MSISFFKNPGSRTAFILLSILILFEYLFFYTYACREILWSYPNNHDQATYLYRTYSLWTAFVGRDATVCLDSLRSPFSTGFLFPIQGAVMCLLFGAGRLACLSLNFLYFAGLQVAFFGLIRRITGNTWAGYVGVGLLLAQGTAFFWAGGLFDFRIDFAASFQEIVERLLRGQL